MIAGFLLTIYGLFFKILHPVYAEEKKSIVLICVLVALTPYRDKFEKKIACLYDPAQLHFGRAILTPLAYICFTVLMMLD